MINSSVSPGISGLLGLSGYSGNFGTGGNNTAELEALRKKLEQMQSTAMPAYQQQDPFMSASAGGIQGGFQTYINKLANQATQALNGGLLAPRPQALQPGNAGGTPEQIADPRMQGLLSMQPPPAKAAGAFGQFAEATGAPTGNNAFSFSTPPPQAPQGLTPEQQTLRAARAAAGKMVGREPVVSQLAQGFAPREWNR